MDALCSDASSKRKSKSLFFMARFDNFEIMDDEQNWVPSPELGLPSPQDVGNFLGAFLHVLIRPESWLCFGLLLLALFSLTKLYFRKRVPFTPN